MMMFLAVVLVLVAALLLFAATRPGSFRVERSIDIKAPAQKVFDAINDFRRWAEWSPWEHIDPALGRTYSGAPAGVGTVYEWTGNGKVGTGRMEITSSAAPSKIVIRLDFLKPFEAHNTAEFVLEPVGAANEPAGGAVRVTWVMYGPANFMSKLMGVFVSMDRMVGGSFAQGLANLKRISES